MPIAVIHDYDPAWPVRAGQMLAQIRAALADVPDAGSFQYEHIGSTSVPGLAAKPIVDLQVRMPVLPSMAELADRLRETGFAPARGSRPDSPGVEHDIPRPGDAGAVALYAKRLLHAPQRSAILHVRRFDSPFGEFVVLFRDWLRHRPEQASRYAELKRVLAERHAGDGDYDDYTRAKSVFFDEVEPLMHDWARSRRP